MFLKKINLRIFLISFLFLALAGSASASPISLAELVATQEELETGDKIFGEWGFTSGSGLDANDIFIEVFEINPLLHRLQITGAIFAEDGVPEDFSLEYSVRTANGQPLIKDIGQSLVGGSNAADGAVLISETAWGGGFGLDPFLATSNISFDPPLLPDFSDPPAELLLGDILVFDPVSKVYIQKDVLLVAPEVGLTSVSIINQDISQVPEPASLLLLGSGLLGIAFLSRRRKRG